MALEAQNDIYKKKKIINDREELKFDRKTQNEDSRLKKEWHRYRNKT